MKNKIVRKKFIIIALLVCVSVAVIFNKSSNKVTLDEVKLKEETKVNRKQFAMYVQDENNPENYKEYTDNGSMFPEGYILNVGQSSCVDINGEDVTTEEVISQTDDGKIMVSSTQTVYCTFYFDKKEPHSYEDLYKDDTTMLGSKEKGNDGYLIYHDGIGDYGEYEAGDYSYRFAGNNPDNYVCLDGNNDATGECNDVKKLYRVIGWFQNEETKQYQMKLIKSEYMKTDELEWFLTSSEVSKTTNSDFTPRAEIENVVGFSWNGESSILDTKYLNNWRESLLNEVLNQPTGTYLTSLSAYTEAELIEDTKWYIGGNTSEKIIYQNSMKAAYENELGANKLTTDSQSCTDQGYNLVKCTEALLYEENKKVGLMYATEYGYASAPSNWSSQLWYYSKIENRSANWLYNGVDEWILSRRADNYVFTFSVKYNGEVSGASTSNILGVRPVIVLKSNATIKSGYGSKDRPWRINLPIS